MLLKQSTQRNVMVLMVDDTSHITGAAGLTLTITASKDGAAFSSISPTVNDRGSGWYSITLTTSHTDTLGTLALHITSTGADPTDIVYQVVVELPGLLSSGSGTGQLDFTSGVVKANLAQILGTAFTEGAAGRIADAFKAFFNVASSTLTTASVNQTGDSFARLGAPVGASISADIADVPTANENADALLKRDWTAITGEAARSLLNAARFLRNKWTVTAGVLTVFEEDDSTTAWSGSVATDAGAEPITGNDPS